MKKYAVYKSETGQYCYRYIDTMRQLKGTGFETITEDKLPIVLDGKGGYFSFDPNDSHFVELIESDKTFPLPLERMFKHNDPAFHLGWISPDGETYSCSYTNHNRCAEAIARTFYPSSKFPEMTLHRKGWIEVIDSWDGRERRHGQYVHSETGKITRKQSDKLFDLGLYNKPEVQALINSCESDW